MYNLFIRSHTRCCFPHLICPRLRDVFTSHDARCSFKSPLYFSRFLPIVSGWLRLMTTVSSGHTTGLVISKTPFSYWVLFGLASGSGAGMPSGCGHGTSGPSSPCLAVPGLFLLRPWLCPLLGLPEGPWRHCPAQWWVLTGLAHDALWTPKVTVKSRAADWVHPQPEGEPPTEPQSKREVCASSFKLMKRQGCPAALRHWKSKASCSRIIRKTFVTDCPNT